MKKFAIMLFAVVAMAFTTNSVNAQSVSFTINSIDFKYKGVDAANWCPPGATVTANVLTRTITISKNDVVYFKGKLNKVTQTKAYLALEGVASDLTQKNVPLTLKIYDLNKVILEATNKNGEKETYRLI